MSVEEAAAEIVKHILRNHSHNGEPKETIPVDFDRLIDEVRAGGDCRYWVWHQTCPQRWNGKDIAKWCGCCTAKARLEAARQPGYSVAYPASDNSGTETGA